VTDRVSEYNKRLKRFKKELGSEKVLILQSLFDSLQSEPPHVNRERYRARNFGHIDGLDALESIGLVWRVDFNNQVSPYALPLINTQQAIDLIGDMDTCFKALRSYYFEHTSERLFIKDFRKMVKLPWERIKNAMYYIVEMHVVQGGVTNRFPYDEDASLQLDEAVIKHETVQELFLRHYLMRGFGAPKRRLAKLREFLNPKRAWLAIKNHPAVTFIIALAGMLVYIANAYEAIPVLREILGKISDS